MYEGIRGFMPFLRVLVRKWTQWLDSLFNGISIFMGHLMPKLFFEKKVVVLFNIYEGIRGFMPFLRVFVRKWTQWLDWSIECKIFWCRCCWLLLISDSVSFFGPHRCSLASSRLWRLWRLQRKKKKERKVAEREDVFSISTIFYLIMRTATL